MFCDKDKSKTGTNSNCLQIYKEHFDCDSIGIILVNVSNKDLQYWQYWSAIKYWWAGSELGLIFLHKVSILNPNKWGAKKQKNINVNCTNKITSIQNIKYKICFITYTHLTFLVYNWYWYCIVLLYKWSSIVLVCIAICY